jgi:hypothetical protein
MEQLGVLIPLNDYLTLKSATIMRSVSKTFNKYIEVKKYSFYRIFKQLEINELSIIKMLLNSDQNWLSNDCYDGFLVFHKNGKKIEKYIENTQFYMCVVEFQEKLDGLWDDYPVDEFIEDEAYHHSDQYTNYEPLQKILFKLCLDLY